MRSAESAAAEHLKQGALVIDVRSPRRIQFGPPAARQSTCRWRRSRRWSERQVTDKNQVLLLHCQSGMRSGAAKKRLAALGYTDVFNLGSYERAARIAGLGLRTHELQNAISTSPRDRRQTFPRCTR